MRLVTALVALLIAGSAAAASALPEGWRSAHLADHPLVGAVVDLATGGRTDADNLVARAVASRYVLLGEIHPNPDHHLWQAAILDAVAGSGRKPVVVLEMVPPELGDRLTRIVETPPQDLDEIGRSLDWETRGWPAFALYRPVFEVAVRHGLRLAPGNLDAAVLRRLAGREAPAPDDAERAGLGLAEPLPPALADGLRREIDEGHCGLLPAAMLPAMVDVQRARDHAMASAMRAAGPDGAVLIAGAGHTNTAWGVARLLREAEPGAGVLALALVEVADGRLEPADYGLAHDVALFTPRADLTDHCAALRNRLAPTPVP